MWQVVLAAAVAGSGYVATRLFPSNGDSAATDTDQTANYEFSEELKEQQQQITSIGLTGSSVSISAFHTPLLPTDSNESIDCENYGSSLIAEDGTFRFSSTSSPKQTRVRSGSRKKMQSSCPGAKRIESEWAIVGRNEMAIEQRKCGRRMTVCLKRRKTGKNSAAIRGSCFFKDNSSFGCGLSVGIMYMMAAGKAELSKLNAAMDETSKVVQELKGQVCKTKSFDTSQNATSLRSETIDSNQVRDKHTQARNNKSSKENRDDNGEYPSSVLTEEPETELLEMDQLEAELQFELQKLPFCTTQISGDEEIISNFEDTKTSEKEMDEPEAQRSTLFNYQGVSPFELDKKLSQLFIKQQENQIEELESELDLAHSKLQEKEAELQAMKDCVRRLTQFSLSNASDEETEAAMEPERSRDWDYDNKRARDSKTSVVGMKRAVDFESCRCYIE